MHRSVAVQDLEKKIYSNTTMGPAGTVRTSTERGNVPGSDLHTQLHCKALAF